MTNTVDEAAHYFIRICNEHGERYYLKSSIDERTSTISIHLTDLKSSWAGESKWIALPDCGIERLEI